jgi:hypothetical protein
MSRAVFRCLVPPAARCHSFTGLALAAAVVMLSACSSGGMGGASDEAVGPSGTAASSQADLATQQACRQRVNEMYEVRDRGAIYTPNPSVNTPFSANYQPDVPSRGLSNQFSYDQSVAECEHNAATGADSSPLPLPAPPATKDH